MPAIPQELSEMLKSATADPLLERFTTALFEKANPDFLEVHDARTLLNIAAGAYDFFNRPRGPGPTVEVFNPEPDRDGFSVPHTVIRFELTDRPFIVDSVRAELKRRDYNLYYLLHPVYGVVRGDDGTVVDLGRPGAIKGAVSEAFELYFIDHEPDAGRRQALADAITEVLGDVIHATDAYDELRARTLETARSLRAEAARDLVRAEELEEYASFMEWLDDDNFVFLGYREYDIETRDGEEWLQVTAGSGLGILGKEERSSYSKPVRLADIPPGLRERVTGGRPLTVTKTNAESTVHRPVRMDYIGVKKLDRAGKVVGERRFVGLFTGKAQNTPVLATPILRRKLRQVLELSGATRGGHDYKEIVSVFDSLPREELFWNDAGQLLSDIRTIVTPDDERVVRLSVRADPLGRGVGIIAVMPRDRFNAQVRRRVQRFLWSAVRASHVDYRLTMSEEEEQARLHFFFTTSVTAEDLDPAALERHVTDLSRSWAEDVRERLISSFGRSEGRYLADRYGDAFDERYVADTQPAAALADIAELESLQEGEYRVKVLDAGSPREGSVSGLRVYHGGESLVLSDVLPVLENAGLRVLAQTAYRVTVGEDEHAIESFRVQADGGAALPRGDDASRLTSGLSLLLAGRAEDDRLNGLLLATGLDIRQIALVRAYAGYYAQIQAATSRAFLEGTLVRQAAATEAIFVCFHSRFDPADPTPAEQRAEGFLERTAVFHDTLATVTSLPEDRALRGIHNLVEATVRTNFYLGLERISFKIESGKVSQMPDPRPLYEIAVSAPGVEGTHLRGGPVARGGIRWSDRGDDYRSEVLGLMKTQTTKNAVIVPVGSKGGFFVKRLPATRPELLAHVREQYQTYIRSLLDLTDNLVNGELRQPEGLVIHDGPDHYLVVAADKGTATFSDLANETAAEYDYWLGDAFASGGSHGYDHKSQGITARGAWQTVARHFREIGVDVFEQEFTAAGIGDMGGDVFGNGMLYTPRLRLQAAFNHLHIFLDPEPDAARTYPERQRLFTTPGSSWRDFDVSLISEGGGVFDRSAKEIVLSEQVKRMLDVEADVMSGQDLIRAVLSMPVDLLWNGGIGTYIKAEAEGHADVGDGANDAVRVNATDVRARIIGEGGNLGVTQLARIEYSRGGGRINTDFIDNSGGVDLSDHEVNLKILLQERVASGALTFDGRNELLAAMTDDVCDLVLHNNYRQSLAISLAAPRSEADPQLFYSLQEYLTERGDLDPRVEFLPTARQVQEMARNGQGYTRPELAVLMAYVKMGLYRRLLETDFPDERHFEHYLLDYFPGQLVERFRDATLAHPLRREIVATQFTNKVVDLLGISFVHRTVRDTGATPVEIIRAALIAFEILDADDFVSAVFELDNRVSVDLQHRLLGRLVSAVEGLVNWIILSDLGRIPVDTFVSTYQAQVRDLRLGLERLLPAGPAARFRAEKSELQALGLSMELAADAVSFDYATTSPGVIEASRETGLPLEATASLFYELGERLALPRLRKELLDLPVTSKWEKIGLGGIIMSLRNVQRRLTESAALSGAESAGEFLDAHAGAVGRFERALDDVQSAGELGFASASVLNRMLEQLQSEAESVRQAG